MNRLLRDLLAQDIHRMVCAHTVLSNHSWRVHTSAAATILQSPYFRGARQAWEDGFNTGFRAGVFEASIPIQREARRRVTSS